MDGTARDNGRSPSGAAGGNAAALIHAALQLRWCAPEVALLLAEQAAEAGGDTRMVLRAEQLVAACLNALDRGIEAIGRSAATLRQAAADGAADEVAPLRVELAAAAVEAGDPAAALAVLSPVLEQGTGPPVVQQSALVAAGNALMLLGRPDDAARALIEADEGHAEHEDHEGHEDRESHEDHEGVADPDAALILRAALRARRAAWYRRDGDLAAADADVRRGLELLGSLSDAHGDGGQIHARLLLERVLVLLDRGEPETALREAGPVLDWPTRAAVAGPAGWLRLALATRVHLPAGRHDAALDLLGQAVRAAERHHVDGVLAECLDRLSWLHEVRGEPAEALQQLRAAHAAAYRRRRAIDSARAALAEERVAAGWALPDLVERVAARIGTHRTSRRSDRTVTVSAGAGQHGEDTGAQQLFTAVDHTLGSVKEGGHPHGVAVGGTDPTEAGLEPEAELPGRKPAGGEPECTVPAVDESAGWGEPAEPEPAVVGESASEEAAPDRVAAEQPTVDEPGRHRRDGGRQLPVAELLSTTGLSGGGRSGRRRAENSTSAQHPPITRRDPAVDSEPVRSLGAEPPLGSEQVLGDAEYSGGASDPDVTDSGRAELAAASQAPPAPGLPPLDRTTGGSDTSQDVGLGDLLADALVAFREGRHSWRAFGGAHAGTGDAPLGSEYQVPPAAPDASSEPAAGTPMHRYDLAGEQAWYTPDAGPRSAAGG